MRKIETLAIIPARGGSVRLPRKNLQLFAGVPLVVKTIQQAKSTISINRIVISTDDDEVAKISRQYGVEAIKRPSFLSQGGLDSMIRTVRHALEYLEKYEGYKPLIVVLLQPTSPLRTSEDIETCIKLLIDSGVDTVLSVSGTKNPEITNYLSRTQSPENGAIYVNWRHVIMERNRLAGNTMAYYQMPEDRSIEIHTAEDLEKAEKILMGRETNVDSGAGHQLRREYGTSKADDKGGKRRRGRPSKGTTL